MKKYLDENVYDAAVRRIEYVFDNFERVYVSFSGGKDSGVMVQIALEVARRMDKLPLSVFFLDFEVYPKQTVDFVSYIMRLDGVKPYWVRSKRNFHAAISQIDTQWTTWANPDLAIRSYEDNADIITDESAFPFYKDGKIKRKYFMDAFGEWFADGKSTACLIGIRADESLNRYRTIARKDKRTYNGLSWTTYSYGVYLAYPLYDWRVNDIWVANHKFGYKYNEIYDVMYRHGVKVSDMRVCDVFRDAQRQGLSLMKYADADMWAKLTDRHEGVNFTSRYLDNGRETLGYGEVKLPAGHTFETYANYLLSTTPEPSRKAYIDKINRVKASVTTENEPFFWRFVVKMILKNDIDGMGLQASEIRKRVESQNEIRSKYESLL